MTQQLGFSASRNRPICRKMPWICDVLKHVVKPTVPDGLCGVECSTFDSTKRHLRGASIMLSALVCCLLMTKMLSPPLPKPNALAQPAA